MNAEVMQGVGLVCAAAAINAVYTLPMRLNRAWKWEHSWFAFSALGVAGVPTLIATLTVPGLWSIYRAAGLTSLASMLLFGFLWGVSLVFFGLSLALVGLAIAFAVSLGTSSATGSLLPLLRCDPARLLSSQGLILLAGLGCILFGVGLCGLAGRRREQAEGVSFGRGGSVRGVVFALISGVLGSMLNLGLSAGGDIQRLALAHGASRIMMSNVVWLPCVWAGFLPGVAYCYWLMIRRGNRHLLATGRIHYWLMGALMGLLWYGSIIIYSFATLKLGELGPVIGWPLFMSAIVLASFVAGLLSGEWKKGGRRPLRIMLAGIACLIAAIGVLSLASR